MDLKLMSVLAVCQAISSILNLIPSSAQELVPQVTLQIVKLIAVDYVPSLAKIVNHLRTV